METELSISGFPQSSCALAIMAKAPLAGGVKTRLAPPLTIEEAAELNRCFLRDMTANIAQLAANRRADGFVIYTPAGAESAFDGALPKSFKLLAQRGESLGDRLCNAAEDLLRDGYNSLCLINSDSPTLPQSVLQTGIDLLSREGDRLILGGAEDGGYYLIGLKKVHRRLFDRIAWSTADVLAHTLERAAEIDLEVELLPRWYDVDDAATLDQLCKELFACRNSDGAYPAPYTRNYLVTLIEAGRILPELGRGSAG